MTSSCISQETVFVLPETDHDQYEFRIPLIKCNKTREILIGIPKKLALKPFQVQVLHKDKQAFLMKISTGSQSIQGIVYRFDKTQYGGLISIGQYFGLNGLVSVLPPLQKMSLYHAHEFTLYKLNLGSGTLSPILQQVLQLDFPPQNEVNMSDNLVSQGYIVPAAAGLAVQQAIKSRGSKANVMGSVSAGPAMHFQDSKLSKDIVPAVQVRFAIAF